MDSSITVLCHNIFRPLYLSTAATSFILPHFLFLTWLLPQALGLNLDGSPGSFVQYPPWEPCTNGSLSFEFKTEEPHSLLLYMNRGEYIFYELKLHKGAARLRVKEDEGPLLIRAGHSLDDGQWHNVTIRQDGAMTTLTADKDERSRRSRGPRQTVGPVASNETFLFIGGLPLEWSQRARTLALPSVIFEPRFRGSIRNLIYRNCGGESFRPSLLESKGLLTRDEDLCERGNPCLNGGQCLTTDNGLFCNCVNTEYKGDRCDIQKIPSDATFLGTQYISYNLSRKGDVMVSNVDSISLDFRTKQLNSLLFYTGNSKDHITVGLIDGGIFLTVDLGSGMYEAEIRPSQGRFNDNRWHQLLIKREAKEVNVEVDGMYQRRGSTSGKFVRLSSSVLFVAGSPDTQSLAGSRVRTNFKGCMRKVKYEADSILLDLTEMARRGHGLLSVAGDVIFDKCQELVDSQPVTFTTPESYVTVSTWDRPSLKGSLAFQFRTVEKGGLMMYSNGNRDSHDFFALELVDGHLYLVVDMGSGVEKVQASRLPVSDGKPHDVYYEFTGNKGYISVDGQKESFSSSRVSDRFDLHGHLFVGGVGAEVNASSLPHQLWSAKLGLSYVGCLQDLVVNGRQVDLMAAARIQNRNDVKGYCRRVHDECASHPCNHGGQCVEGWNRFTCDCRATGFVGTVCQTAAITLRFDGTQFMRIHMPREMVTQAEDISLRFRTMHMNGLLFETSGQATDSYTLYLKTGVLYLSINVGGSQQVLSVGHALHDDQWHTVLIKRRRHTVHLSIDQDRPVTDQVRGMASSLTTHQIFIGHRKEEAANDYPRDRRSRTKRVNYGHMQRDESVPENGFVGSMQSFAFNRNHFFELAKSGSSHEMEITAQFSSDEYVVRDPVTFKSIDAYALLPTLQAHAQFSISFQLKTTESNGLLLYNAGKERDFFGMELYQGFLYYVYNMGEGAQRVKANTNHPINDNKWHEIRLLRTETFKQFLRVDANTPTIDDITGNKNTLFDLQGKLFVGGVRKTMYPSLPQLIQSRHGFLGCIGSLNLDGYLPNLLKEAISIHEEVGDGCRGPMKKCLNDSCANHGRCVQQWTSYRCDCDMTSYTGPKCNDESTTYQFGPGPGLMTFTFPDGERPSTNSESVAFGFTSHQENAVIVRMDSVIYDDFIQFELLNGNMYITYNMGTLDHPIGDFYQKINDGHYHVVIFTRNGPNATLQIDSTRPQTKFPAGKQAHTFNQQAHIRIGGKLLDDNGIEDQFEGTISGLVINGIQLFECAKENDARITITGTVERQLKSGETDPVSNKKVGVVDIDQMQSTQGRFETLEVNIPYQYLQRRQYNSTIPQAVKSPVLSPQSKQKELQVFKLTRKRRHQHGFERMTRRSQYLDASHNIPYGWKENGDTQKAVQQNQAINALQEVLAYLGSSPATSSSSQDLGLTYGSHKSNAPWSKQNSSCWFCGQGNEVNRDVPKKQYYSSVTRSPYDGFIQPQVKELGAPEESPIWTGSEEWGESENDNEYNVNNINNNNNNNDDRDEADSEDSEEVIVKLNEYLMRNQPNMKERNDNDVDDDEDYLNRGEGSAWYSPEDYINISQWVVQHKMGLYREDTSTIVSPFLTRPRTQPPRPTAMHQQQAHWNVFNSHTTPRDGVTDDIISPGSGCQSDDEDRCSVAGSGTEDEIITPVIIIKSTKPPPTTSTTTTTTEKVKPPCRGGHDCETSSKLRQQSNESHNTGRPYGPETGHTPSPENPHGVFDGSSATPGKTINNEKDGDDDDKGINLALILGIIGSVLVAIIVLCVAWCKLRSRDEGTYKVDETQNFSALQSKKSHGNGALMAGSESGTGKRGKKKDVKEWYV